MANLVTNSLIVYGSLSELNRFVASVIDAERNQIAFDTLIPMPDLKMTDDGNATDHLVGGLFYGASINTRLQWMMANVSNIRDNRPLELNDTNVPSGPTPVIVRISEQYGVIV